MSKVLGIIGISKVEFFNFSGTERVKQNDKKKKEKIKNNSKTPKLVRQSLFKQLQQNPNTFLEFH